MRIIIKEVEADSDYYNTLNYVGQKLYDFKLSFVLDRLDVLNSELSGTEKHNPSAMIMLTMQYADLGEFIKSKGYSNILTEKIHECFKKERMYFEDKLAAIVQTNLN